MAQLVDYLAEGPDPTGAKLRVLLRPKLLVIDEVGNLPLGREAANWFFELVSRRYLRGSIILTSNKSYAEWGSLFPDWDKWTCLPYGLLCLAQGKPKSWQDIASVTLHDRVAALSKLPNPAPLVCDGQDSVTIRNALVHGNATYNPRTRKVIFEAKNREPIILPASQVRIKAIDMVLSNLVMSRSVLLAVDTVFDWILPEVET